MKFCVSVLTALAVIALCRSGFAQGPPECNVEKYGANHTMCLYQSESTSPRCMRLRHNHTRIMRRSILNLANKLRSYVAGGFEVRGVPGPQPAAKDMNEIVWDDELQKYAQRWADQCPSTTDQNRNTTTLTVSQNVYSIVGDFVSLRDPNSALLNVCESGLRNWYQEVAIFPKGATSNLATPPRSLSGSLRYIALMRANTTAMGCGYSVYLNEQGTMKGFCACNFGVPKDTNMTLLYTADSRGDNICKLCTKGCEDSLCKADPPGTI